MASDDDIPDFAAGCVIALFIAAIGLLFQLLRNRVVFIILLFCVVIAIVVALFPVIKIPPIPVPPFLGTTYIINTNGANGRECPKRSCKSRTTFNAGDKIDVVGEIPGEKVGKNNIWYIVWYENSNIYVHSSLADKLVTPIQNPVPDEIDYFALGDSIAAGHGLSDNLEDPCRQSNLAYPFKLRDKLQAKYRKTKVVLHHFACSGATALLPSQNLTHEWKWLNNQVDKVIEVLSNENRPTSQKSIVSVTIGIDDYPWTDADAIARILVRFDRISFGRYVNEHTSLVAKEVRTQMEKILKKSPNTTIVITEYYNPMNVQSVLFLAVQKRLDDKFHINQCNIFSPTCYDRTTIAIQKLNNALREQVVRELAKTYPGRIVMTVGLYDEFDSLHVAPRNECGKDKPDTETTWIQFPSDEKSFSFPGEQARLLAEFSSVQDWTKWRGDCFHPNELGMNEYAHRIALSLNVEQ